MREEDTCYFIWRFRRTEHGTMTICHAAACLVENRFLEKVKLVIDLSYHLYDFVRCIHNLWKLLKTFLKVKRTN